MPPPQTRPTTTGGAQAPKWTLQQVLDMFGELGLPVCDDGGLIAQKFTAKRDYYMSLLRKPDPKQREKGEAGVKGGEALQNRRPELLRVVFEEFQAWADTALAGFMAAGEDTLTAPIVDQLRNHLRTKCRTDDALTTRFLDEYIKGHGFELDKKLVNPPRVETFVARGGLGKVVLEWDVPKGNCDEVEIVREAERGPGVNGADQGEVVYRGRDSSLVDHGVQPGVWYRYRARAVFQQQFRGTDSFARAVCIGEVRDAKAAWKDGAVQLSWRPPGPSGAEGVWVFRSGGGPVQTRRGPQGPEPSGPATQCVYRGGDTSWADAGVSEGAVYHYRLFAAFGHGLFSDGVDLQATVPRPPPPVPWVTAAYKHDAGKDVVEVAWQPVSAGMPVEYVVVRREGNAPPGRVEEGTALLTTAFTRHLDEHKIIPGRRYSYAVFTLAAGRPSRTGTPATPVEVLPEVSGLAARTGDGTVELSWTTPANVARVLVRRSLSQPRDHTDGTLVPPTGPGHAKDTGLRNGQRYFYRVCCVYRPDGVHEVVSRGVCLDAVPDQLPDLVTDFAAHGHDKEIVCTWTPPAHGQVVVLRSARAHGLALGHRLKASELDRLGERVVASGTGRARDVQPDVAKPHYSAFTVAGEYAIAGGTGSCVIYPDVAALQATVTRDGVLLRWGWPSGCTAVRVVRRSDRWPEGPDDPQATAVPCMRIDYARSGEKFIDRVQGERARFYYMVYAQAPGTTGLFYSPGLGTGCRAVVQWEPWMTLRYRLELPGSGSHKGKDLKLTWTVEDPFPDFAGFTLVASQTKVPADPADGVELFRWTPDRRQADEGEHEAWVSLDLVQKKRWARFFCKALVIDPGQRQNTLVVHPNTCVPLPALGPLPAPKSLPRVRSYRAGAPATVICPTCFKEYPVGEMLFASYEDDDALPGRRGLIDWLLRRPPRPPVRNGRVLPRKLCPYKERPELPYHDLPFTAGTQGSLVIGVIGAKFSGKSHYIAALVERLQSQVGSDLQASLVPVSTKTQERYDDEFYKPLFGNNLELPQTVGTPPPLIYDLTLNGSLWGEERNRAVTLALYDTAGENFNNRDAVRQMLHYLRVASGIIFLIDPLQVEAVQQALPAALRPSTPPGAPAADPYQIMTDVLTVLEDARFLNEGGSLSVPVAVALTKCDVLRDAGLIEANRLWNTDARHIGFFDPEAHEDVNGMMGEHVQRWSQRAYHMITQRFTRHAFFGVSATGCASDKATRRYRYIAPWRVEDPLLWLLAELNVIPKR